MKKGSRPNKIFNTPLAFHLLGTEVRPVAAVKEQGQPLPRKLIIPPGFYRFQGQSFALTREGMYRFRLPPEGNQQRVVYQKDVVSLLSAISWMTTHGSVDNPRSHRELRQWAQKRKLIVTCGRVAQFGHELLRSLGVPSRVVSTRTLEKLNTYDNGHVLLEVFLDGKWTLVDLDVNKMFQRRGRRLSLLEFVDAVAADDYQFENLSLSTPIAIGGFTEEGYDYSFWMETALPDAAHWRRWYRRIMMVPQIHGSEGACAVVDTPAKHRKAQRLCPEAGFQFLPRVEFEKEFYGSDTR